MTAGCDAARSGRFRLLENEREIEVIGTTDGVGAIRLTRKLSPDVVVMDLNMPGEVISATRQVKTVRPNVKVIAVTATPEFSSPLFFANSEGTRCCVRLRSGSQIESPESSTCSSGAAGHSHFRARQRLQVRERCSNQSNEKVSITSSGICGPRLPADLVRLLRLLGSQSPAERLENSRPPLGRVKNPTASRTP